MNGSRTHFAEAPVAAGHRLVTAAAHEEGTID
jgi:hypothetical protein